ncbi:hypothetical protein [Streptomyces sp. NPDC002671]
MDVPADAAPPSDGKWRAPYTDSLLPAHISPLPADCPAGTVLWLIDACRTDTAYAEAETRAREICGGRPLLAAWLEAARSTASANGCSRPPCAACAR